MFCDNTSFSGLVHNVGVDGVKQFGVRKFCCYINAIDKTSKWTLGENPLFWKGGKRFNTMLKGFKKKDPIVKKRSKWKFISHNWSAYMPYSRLGFFWKNTWQKSLLIEFYLLIHRYEYFINGTELENKQTVKSQVKYVTFFKRNLQGDYNRYIFHPHYGCFYVQMAPQPTW